MPSTDLRAKLAECDSCPRPGDETCMSCIYDLAVDVWGELPGLLDRLDAAEKALRECASTAGTPDEAQGCRNVIAIARAYFASVEGGQNGQ